MIGTSETSDAAEEGIADFEEGLVTLGLSDDEINAVVDYNYEHPFQPDPSTSTHRSQWRGCTDIYNIDGAHDENGSCRD